MGWGAVHLRDGGMDGGRRKGKLPSVKEDKEEDIDRRIERKESEWKLILTSALHCRLRAASLPV